MLQLFEDDDPDLDLDLKTDTDFAKGYNTWRRKEELHKLQTKYGNDSSDSSSSSEDDEGEEVNEQFEKDFFKTLSCLKNKDPRIYDKNFEFFNDDKDDPTSSPKKKKKEQPVYLKDYERKLILEKGGQLSDDEANPEPRSTTYVEEQEKLKESLKEALNNVDEDKNEDGEWGGLFKTRQKTTEEKLKEEEDYLQWLAGQTEHLKDENVENDLKPLKEFWTNPKLDEGEKFLRDYVLKKKFLDNEDTDYIPTYEEVVHDSDENLSEDEKVLDTQEEFEHKYNFRFEEPDQEFIKRYPRTMETSLRQKDDKRKIKRSEKKERKMLEKKQKMEEIRQLQAMKKKEIEEKIEKLKEITGNTEVGFDIKDLEDDFDPEEHDKRMKNLFDEKFYEEPESEQKPEFPEIDKELELENWDYWHGDKENGDDVENEEHQPHCEDEDFNMDCDYDPANTQQELVENSKRKKRRRKSKFAKVLSQPKPVFDPNNKTYQQYLDEYYKLDCEDIIGDLPCRFKYREVVPNSFGLSVEEILMAKDKELNRWCSLKKAIQHRPEHVEKYDVIAFQRKGQNVDLKKKYLPSLFEEEKVEETFPSTSSNRDSEKKVPKKKRNRKNKMGDADVKNNGDANSSTNNIHHQTNQKEDMQSLDENLSTIDKVEVSAENSNEDMLVVEIKKKKKRKRKISHSEMNSDSVQPVVCKKPKHGLPNKKNKQHNKKATEDIGISDARLAAYGLNPKKFKNKLKYGSN